MKSKAKNDLPPVNFVKNPPLKPRYDFNKKNKHENYHVNNHAEKISDEKKNRKMKY